MFMSVNQQQLRWSSIGSPPTGQYKLARRATALGWPKHQVNVIDEDMAQSGSSSAQRGGFTMMTTEVAMGQVGLILSIEVSRVARNNADWYRLLDLCSVTDTLIGDEDGIYHPGLFNDRLLPRIERNHGRGRTACDTCQARRRHSQ